MLNLKKKRKKKRELKVFPLAHLYKWHQGMVLFLASLNAIVFGKVLQNVA